MDFPIFLMTIISKCLVEVDYSHHPQPSTVFAIKQIKITTTRTLIGLAWCLSPKIILIHKVDKISIIPISERRKLKTKQVE